MTTGEWLLFVFVMIAVPATLIGIPVFVFMGGSPFTVCVRCATSRRACG